MRIVLLLLAVALPSAALAAGGHDAVGCTGCHSTRAAGPPRNETVLDPRTGKANGLLSARCLACHADVEDGGRGVAPASRHFNHPFSVAKVNPKLARVPPELLRDGSFECVGCHDPHPSNPNYRYLRIAVTRSPTLAELCFVCHPAKGDPSARVPPPLSTTDERAAAPAAERPRGRTP